jgi:sugar phosphate permease
VDEAVIEQGPPLDPSLVIDPHAERVLLRKIDVYLMTIFGALYLLCFLDRGNIGSANVASPSISQSLGLSAQQYGAVVSVVYATYVVFEPVWANLLKILSPKYVRESTALVIPPKGDGI